ncbi:hypothetical protein [Arsukibacterium indicum]|uniref:Holin n=1 Tax=Arsukibacterium indicum TaxID=2848612 RepID=A0ABS6MGJ9_9GAMM|nr:hypothetical protein [Arsukibacterium indicum]MBV2127933.1 hypothetical protein [Arsukibacterium indicum]
MTMNTIAIRPMSNTTTAFTYVSAVGTAIGGWLTISNAALLIGVMVTIALGYIQWQVWYNRKCQDAERHEWERRRHELELKALISSAVPMQLVNQSEAGDPADPKPPQGGAEAR